MDCGLDMTHGDGVSGMLEYWHGWACHQTASVEGGQGSADSHCCSLGALLVAGDVVLPPCPVAPTMCPVCELEQPLQGTSGNSSCNSGTWLMAGARSAATCSRSEWSCHCHSCIFQVRARAATTAAICCGSQLELLPSPSHAPDWS